jgi:hypothetical protein
MEKIKKMEKMEKNEKEELLELFNKENFVFKRYGVNKYLLEFDIENKNIYMEKIFDFSLLELIYKLNPDIYEHIEFNKIDDTNAIALLLMKHFFEDIGFPQRFSFMNIKKLIEKNKILFKAQTIIQNERPQKIPKEAEILNIDNLTCVCDLITPHNVKISFDINFNSGFAIPLFAEKLIGVIIHKIFKRLKLFIEKITI